jgi:putative phage-type endonuclease
MSNLINDINAILSGCDISDTDDLSPQQIDSIISTVFNMLEQFHPNQLEYSDIYNTILDCILSDEWKQNESSDEQEELQIQLINGNSFLELEDLKQELQNSINEVDDTLASFQREQFKNLRAQPVIVQRSQEWYEIRKGMCTASDIAPIIGEGKYKSRNDIIKKKCGKGKPFTGNAATRHGQRYEDVAIGIYESRRGFIKVYEFGLLPHPTISCVGASPDGITKDGVMVEIKCPPRRKINGKPPHGYWCQMQTQMEVCNLMVCDFFEALLVEYPNKETYLEDKFNKDTLKDKEFENIYGENKIGKLEILLEGEIAKIGLFDYVKVSDDRRSSNGLEKGVIGRVMDMEKNEEKIVYPPMNLSTDEQEYYINKKIDKWTKKKKYKLLGNKLIYWKLIRSSNVRVKRDVKWFQMALPKIKAFWAEVEERRKKGEHSCDDLIKPIKRSIALDDNLNYIATGSCLLDDSSDEEQDETKNEEIILNTSDCLIDSSDD